MTGRSKRTTALLNSGTLSPNPWDLSLSGQNDWPYTEGTRTEDKAPQGCDLSAAFELGDSVPELKFLHIPRKLIYGAQRPEVAKALDVSRST
jgi:hypothetical protein